MLQPHKQTSHGYGCQSGKCAKPTTLRINKISESPHSEPHPATCCSDKAPLAASACCASDNGSSQPSEHSPTTKSDDDSSGDGDSDPAALPAGTCQLSWKVSGMDCPSCARTIETAVSNVAGIHGVKVQFATEKLVVSANSDISAKVEQAVIKAGFTL